MRHIVINFVKRLTNIQATYINSGIVTNDMVDNRLHWVYGMGATGILFEAKLALRSPQIVFEVIY